MRGAILDKGKRGNVIKEYNDGREGEWKIREGKGGSVRQWVGGREVSERSVTPGKMTPESTRCHLLIYKILDKMEIKDYYEQDFRMSDSQNNTS